MYEVCRYFVGFAVFIVERSTFTTLYCFGVQEAMNSPKLSKSRRDQFSKVFPDIAETEEVIKCKSVFSLF